MLARVITIALLVSFIFVVGTENLSAAPLVPTEVVSETFDTNTADLASTLLAYPDFTGFGTLNVSSQQLEIVRGGNNNLLTSDTFNEEIWVSGEMTLTLDSGGIGGGTAPGLVIGNRIFDFFPEFAGGSFRIMEYTPGTGVIGASLIGNNNLGFTPAGDVLHQISVHWDGGTDFDVEIIDGNNPLNVYAPATFTVPGTVGGAVGFSVIHGSGTGLFDNLSVTALREQVVPEPSSLLLLGLGALGMMRHTRRRRKSSLA